MGKEKKINAQYEGLGPSWAQIGEYRSGNNGYLELKLRRKPEQHNLSLGGLVSRRFSVQDTYMYVQEGVTRVTFHLIRDNCVYYVSEVDEVNESKPDIVLTTEAFNPNGVLKELNKEHFIYAAIDILETVSRYLHFKPKHKKHLETEIKKVLQGE